MLSVILAAGPGTRIRPLSYFIPKILLPVRGRPVLEYLLDCFARADIRRHYIIASDYRETIEDYLKGTKRRNVEVIRGLGWETGGDLSLALEQIQPEADIVVANGDIVTDIDVRAIVGLHKKIRPLVTMGAFEVRNRREARRFGLIDLDPEGWIRAFREKPSLKQSASSWVNTGLYVFDKSLVTRLRSTYLTPHRFRLEVELFPRLAREGRLLACRTSPRFWWDVGTMKSYLVAEKSLTIEQAVIPP